MSADRHASDAPGHDGAVAHHATDDHGGDHGHDDHAHEGDDGTLGPIDVYAWGAGALGVAIGAVIAICLVAATASPT